MKTSICEEWAWLKVWSNRVAGRNERRRRSPGGRFPGAGFWRGRRRAALYCAGEGALLFDADGNEYIDYVGSWGPLILGHAEPTVLEAIVAAARKGSSFGASTPGEVDLAEAVLAAVPSMEKVRFVSSGTEATMSAIRLARAFTQRKYSY